VHLFRKILGILGAKTFFRTNTVFAAVITLSEDEKEAPGPYREPIFDGGLQMVAPISQTQSSCSFYNFGTSQF